MAEQLEYRLIKMDIGKEKGVISNLFDFGCTVIVQDHQNAFRASQDSKPTKIVSDEDLASESKIVTKFAENLVMAVLHRMYRGKVLSFNDITKIKPDAIAIWFYRFMDWYNADVQYLETMLKSANPGGLKTGDEGTGEDNNNFYFVSCSLAEGLHKTLTEIYNEDFENIALWLYRGEVKRLKEYYAKLLK